MEDKNRNVEKHPLPPFLPANAKILMSGSFPPPLARWSMHWFYPNRQNDMWQIWGIIAAGDKKHFLTPDGRGFEKEKIVDYCKEIGLALSDTGEEVVRMRNNASDKFLQVVKPRDFDFLLRQIPECSTVVLTGEKAVETMGSVYGFKHIPVGEYIEVEIAGRMVKVWRMPSSSRAFPRSVEWKAEYYKKVVDEVFGKPTNKGD